MEIKKQNLDSMGVKRKALRFYAQQFFRAAANSEGKAKCPASPAAYRVAAGFPNGDNRDEGEGKNEAQMLSPKGFES